MNTERNRLFKINKKTLYRDGFYDNIKTAYIHNNTLFMGKGDGIIKIINKNTSRVIELPHSFVASFTFHDSGYYAGLNNGYILRLKNE